jgi:hypothetical protein
MDSSFSEGLDLRRNIVKSTGLFQSKKRTKKKPHKIVGVILKAKTFVEIILHYEFCESK